MIATLNANFADELEIANEESAFAPVRHLGLGINPKCSAFEIEKFYI